MCCVSLAFQAKAQEEAAALRKQVEDAQAQVASLEEKHRKELSAATANAGALVCVTRLLTHKAAIVACIAGHVAMAHRSP